jgi:hypothetical protein
MDDPIGGPDAPLRLQRICEDNRLGNQVLVNAYECLLAALTHGESCEGNRPRVAKPPPRHGPAGVKPPRSREGCGI